MSDRVEARSQSEVVTGGSSDPNLSRTDSAPTGEESRLAEGNGGPRYPPWMGLDGLSSALHQTESVAPVEDDFQVRLDSTQLGALVILRFDSDPLSGSHTPAAIADVSDTSLHLGIVSSGGARLTQRNRVAELEPGDSVFMFAGEPYQYEVIERSSLVDIMIPLAHFGDRANLILDQLAIRLMHTPLLAAAVEFFVALATTLPTLTSGAADYAERAVLDLITAVIAERTDSSPELCRRQELRTRIHDFIRLHIRDPALTPQRIAQHVGISREYLYRVFDADGVTIGRFIRQLRLESVAGRLLADGSVTVAQLAEDTGFSGGDQLTRLFRQTYGLTPTQYRRVRGLTAESETL